MPEVVPSVPGVPSWPPEVAPSVVVVMVAVVLVLFRLISVTMPKKQSGKGLLTVQPVSDRTMLLPPVPAVVAVRVNGFAAAPGVTVAFAADTFVKQGAALPHRAELFSMAARRFFVVFKWPAVPDPPSSTALAGDEPPGRLVTIE